MAKLKVYVQSFEMPTVGFVDREGAMHACAQAQKSAFKGLEQHAGLFGNRYLADEEKEALMRIEDFCRNNNLEFEIVDLGTVGFLGKLKVRLKGLKTPAVCSGNRTFNGVPSEEDFKELLAIVERQD
jgi:hypothetical protein